jgi:sec-independent protein translocase protein TatB
MFPEGRLFDFLIVGAVALVVVGPKDLPLLMRKVGQFTARLRGMAAEFRASFDELARQSELDELRREVSALRAARPADFAAQHLGAGDLIADINSDLAQTNATLNAPALPAEDSPPASDAHPAPEPSDPTIDAPEATAPKSAAPKASAK